VLVMEFVQFGVFKFGLSSLGVQARNSSLMAYKVSPPRQGDPLGE
jgi:hypothetical protein